MNKLISTISFFLFAVNQVLSCECILLKDHWERIHNYDIIVKVKIINHFDYEREGGFLPNTITELKLIEVLNGEISDSTLYYPNNMDSCARSLDFYSKNEELIIKANYIKYDSYELEHLKEYIIHEKKYTEKLVINDGCDDNVFHIVQNRVKRILKKRLNRKRGKKYLKLRDTEGADHHKYFLNYIWDAKPNSYITYEKYKRQLHRKLK